MKVKFLSFFFLSLYFKEERERNGARWLDYLQMHRAAWGALVSGGILKSNPELLHASSDSTDWVMTCCSQGHSIRLKFGDLGFNVRHPQHLNHCTKHLLQPATFLWDVFFFTWETMNTSHTHTVWQRQLRHKIHINVQTILSTVQLCLKQSTGIHATEQTRQPGIWGTPQANQQIKTERNKRILIFKLFPHIDNHKTICFCET